MEAASVVHCGDHRVATEDCDQGHRNEGDDFDGLDSEVSGSGHEPTCNDDDRPGADSQGFCCGDAEHRDADTEPTHLREGDERRGEVGTDTSEGVAGHEVEAQSGLCADVAQGSGVDGQDRAADDHRPHVLRVIETVSELCSNAHRGGEEGEAEHNKTDGPKRPSVLRWNCFK